MHSHTRIHTHKKTMVINSRIHPEKRSGKEKNLPLNLHVFFDKKRVITFYTGFRCDVNQWNNEDQKMKNNQVNKAGQSSAYINVQLKAIRGAVDTWAKDNPTGTKDDLLKVLRAVAGKKEKVEVDLLEGSHGFADPFSEKYSKDSADEAERIIRAFFEGLSEQS